MTLPPGLEQPYLVGNRGYWVNPSNKLLRGGAIMLGAGATEVAPVAQGYNGGAALLPAEIFWGRAVRDRRQGNAR